MREDNCSQTRYKALLETRRGPEPDCGLLFEDQCSMEMHIITNYQEKKLLGTPKGADRGRSMCVRPCRPFLDA